MDSALTLVIGLLLGSVFVAVLVEYVRRRSPVSRDLVLVFASIPVGPAPAWRPAPGAACLSRPYQRTTLIEAIRSLTGGNAGTDDGRAATGALGPCPDPGVSIA